MRTACRSGLAILAGALLALGLPAVSAADSGFVSPLEELPLTAPLATGARAIGMGGVAMAVSDDASALTSNPAGLTRLNRIELSGGFRRSNVARDGEMMNAGFETDLSGTDFTSLRFAYPFPTFRGSLVFAVGAERAYDFAEDHLAAYDDSISWQETPGQPDEYDLWGNEEDFLSDGGVTALSAGAAVDVSPSISLGAALSYLTGDYTRDFRWDLYDYYDVSDTYTEVHIIEQYSSDVSGLRATFGALFYVSEQLSFGLAADTPFTLTFDGSERSYIRTETTVPESTGVSDYTVLFSDEVTLPFAFRGGVAYSPTDMVVLAADVSYSDWSEIDYAGRITETDEDDGVLGRRAVYEETIEYCLGVEVTVPSWPLRIRGGYSSRPLAYRGLDIDTDRSYFTIGAGVLIDTVLALDVAWMKGGFERSGSDYDFKEETDDSALILEATYRF